MGGGVGGCELCLATQNYDMKNQESHFNHYNPTLLNLLNKNVISYHMTISLLSYLLSPWLKK